MRLQYSTGKVLETNRTGGRHGDAMHGVLFVTIPWKFSTQSHKGLCLLVLIESKTRGTWSIVFSTEPFALYCKIVQVWSPFSDWILFRILRMRATRNGVR
ncbi:hypothetical protein GGI42DRAFT_209368 [Trichoderma sp. SZMC 28013]